MSRRSLDVYAERARLISDETVASGRRPIDRDAWPAIRADIIARLGLNGGDRLLDIGSGIGATTVPLSYFVGHVTAVDHPDVLARMPERPNIEKLPGDFLTLDLGERRFTKAVAYSMIHYLGSRDDILALVDKTIEHLEPNGLLLLGDVPNDKYRERNCSTPEGQRLVLDIGLRMVKAEGEKRQIESVLAVAPDMEMPQFDDDLILGIVAHVRASGHNAWPVRQTPGLPFAHVREDILIQKVTPAPVRDLFITQADDGTYLPLAIREIHSVDRDTIYAWSCDPQARVESVRSEAFSIEQHREWFADKLAEMVAGDLRWYILEEGARIPIGSIRYERIRAGRPLWTGGPIASEDGGSEVSVMIAPLARGFDLATIFLARSEPHARKTMPGPLIALIRPENIPSIKAFERAGYQYVRDEERLGVALRRYEK